MLCQHLAARRLQTLQNQFVDIPLSDANFSSEYRHRFSFSCLGKRYLDRLDKFWSSRDVLAQGLKWQTE